MELTLQNTIEQLKEAILEYPYENWELGWNAAIRMALQKLEALDKYQ